MSDFSLTDQAGAGTSFLTLSSLRKWILVGIGTIALLTVVSLLTIVSSLSPDSPVLADSTFGELATWMADASGQEDTVSILGQYARNWAQEIGAESLPVETLVTTMHNSLLVWLGAILVLTTVGILATIVNSEHSRSAFAVAMVMLIGLLFIFPISPDDNIINLALLGILLFIILIFALPGHISRIFGFIAILALVLVTWEVMKSAAESIDRKVSIPQPEWVYSAYPSLDDALDGLSNGEIVTVIADKRDLDDLMPPFPEDGEIQDTLPYPDLRYLDNLETDVSILGLPVEPEVPGRLAFAVPVDNAANWSNVDEFVGQNIGAVTGDFAEERLLNEPRSLILLDLKILNDLNLPPLQSIAEAYLQPARRNGPVLLIRILFEAALFTMQEAVLGFAFGAMLGFLLGVLFAHSGLLEQGLLPYVVASQTVPILAIAPMVVIWLGAGPVSVAVIAAYLTFFPVTINTLRGLQSPNPIQVELMQSYAANRRTILRKLRLPAALPYIFTALKVSATASVVGAIIGELPSGIRDGLGRAILDFSSDYSLISTPKLWAAIIMAAMAGIFFFAVVSIAEQFFIKGRANTD